MVVPRGASKGGLFWRPSPRFSQEWHTHTPGLPCAFGKSGKSGTQLGLVAQVAVGMDCVWVTEVPPQVSWAAALPV